MTDTLEQAYLSMQERFAAEVKFHGPEKIVYLHRDNYLAAMQALRQEFGFDRLSDLSAVDYWPKTSPRYNVVIHLHARGNNDRIAVRVPVEAADSNLPTLVEVYENANWYEREVADLFGIVFLNHPDPRRIIMPQDWQGHPLRRDYPLGYEQVQFTFNFDKIEAKKIYAKE